MRTLPGCIGTEQHRKRNLCRDSLNAVNEIQQDVNVHFLPNPFSSNLIVESSDNQQLEIILYDILSRKLLQQQFTNSISINTELLAKGIYIYKVRNKMGVIKNGKVVKD